MSLIWSKLAIALISPLGTALLLGALGLLAGLGGRRRIALFLGAVALLWLLTWSLPVASHALRHRIEYAYPPLALRNVPAAPAIVVLGGGMNEPTDWNPWADLGAASDRVWHAARLYRAGKAPLLLLSGGSDPAQHRESEAASMRSLLLDFGIPARAMLLEERSRTTAENARYSALLLRQRRIDTVLLLTSALHMERARRLFEAQGLRVIPVATDHEARDTSRMPAWQRWLPSADALDGSARALKEWVGRLGSR